jgi:iron(III) transport system substrate-binding protein
MIRHLVVVAILGLLIAAPIALRATPLVPPAETRRLIILTPHGEAIRGEFATAFHAWAKRARGLEVEIDWRTPGGTADITRFIDERFRIAFRERFPEHRAALDAFNEPKLKDPTPAQRAARAAFLASDVGTGADLIFGGGEFVFRAHAERGYLVDSGLLTREPGWFAGPTPLIPQAISGENVYDPQGRYFGACFAVFGIAYAPDRLAERGIPAPHAWSDIAGPAWLGGLSLTDPTKSGAAATAFERVLQQQMAVTAPDLDRGWIAGFTVIKQLVANSRWITDSASKPTRDTVRGDCLAAMAIDFQAKAEAEFAAAAAGGVERLRFVVPVGGTSVSADPIGVLRGAPEPELAREFIHFVLSPEGQRLWNQKVGTPGGPQHYALRRYPVRRDLVGPDQAAVRSDPDEDPFVIAAGFTFHPEWTGKAFFLISALIKTVALDTREELIPAWTAICQAGGPERVPEAWEQFTWLPVSYAGVTEANQDYRASPKAAVTLQRQWIEEATVHYRLARAYAEAGR